MVAVQYRKSQLQGFLRPVTDLAMTGERLTSLHRSEKTAQIATRSTTFPKNGTTKDLFKIMPVSQGSSKPNAVLWRAGLSERRTAALGREAALKP